MYEKMQTVDLGAIKPQGWVKEFLATQANGLTGKLRHMGYPYSIAFWKGETREATKRRRGKYSSKRHTGSTECMLAAR